MKNILILTIVLLCLKTFSQTKNKKYKYAIVPVQFGFLDEENKYQLNVLTRVRLKEIGFEVFMDEEEKKPKELELDRCLALNANVKRNKGLLTTTLIFELKNCFGKLIYESQGESRLKSYKDAYQEALNRALDKFETDAVLYLKTSNEKKANKVTEVVTFDNKSKEKLPFEKRANPYQLYGQIYWLLQEGNN
ncbi:MAG: hypothetical protein GVY05_04190, partial [Bacteroidetes bacterium]|nr:hypothetical protein [Bacteroidota bacterium]